MSKKSEKPPEPIRLCENSIIAGVFYRAGEALPFEHVEDLPESLKGLVATEADPAPWTPAERNIYYRDDQGPEPGEAVIYQATGGGQWVRRQAAQLASGLQEQIYAEQEAQAANKLSPELEEVLQDSHDKHIALTKAQMEASQRLTDAIYEDAAQRAEPQKFYVKRGAVYVDARKAKVKPAENVFVKRSSGEYECVGVADSEGQLPDEEIRP